MRLPFAKYLPGGNPTILVPGELVPDGFLPVFAARLMRPLHLGAEQVGALFVGAGVPHLEMMGGEFCVNASRAAALELAGRGAFARMGEQAVAGPLSVSGLEEPIPVLVADNRATLCACRELLETLGFPQGAGSPMPGESLYCATGVPLRGADLEHFEQGRTLVRLPGICHLLLDTALHPLPADPFAAARAERSRHNLDKEPAAGVIWCGESAAGPAITPLVWVAATNSTHLETACGSASLALALAREKSVSIFQPSGEVLDIDLDTDRAWVSGRVDRIARGETWVDDSEAKLHH